MKLFLLILLTPFCGFASVEIAFIELRNYQGELIELEPNGKFAHMAISYKGHWLHSHPFRGVEIIPQDKLEEIGTINAIVTIPETPSLTEVQVKKFLGKPYDTEFSWSDERIYCSELIAKLLHIEPKPMSFASKAWPESFRAFKGKLGLSPDDIFKALIQKDYNSDSFKFRCSKIFR